MWRISNLGAGRVKSQVASKGPQHNNRGPGPDLGQDAPNLACPLHFRSPTNLPSTSTPPTLSVQVSVSCLCLP